MAGQKPINSQQAIQDAVPDCIAICAPGAAVTVSLLIERIVLRIVSSPASPANFTLTADELYDILIRPDTDAIDSLLFVSPHSLFDIKNPATTFPHHAEVQTFHRPLGEDWHFPLTPEVGKANVAVDLHTRNYQPDLGPFQKFEGTLKECTLSIPKILVEPASLSVLDGLGRSVFECRFTKPIQPGESTWVRVAIRPRRLVTPPPTPDPSVLERVCQILDVLSPETMLESFRDLLTNMQSPKLLPGELARRLNNDDLKQGLENVMSTVFEKGFDSPGTYTRVEDHRILLTSAQCKINFIKEEGCVELQAIAPRVVSGVDSLVYNWYSGTVGYQHLDPFIATERLYTYATRFANVETEAKSKPYFTYVTGIDHLLGCEIIDELVGNGFFGQTDSGGKLEHYYFKLKQKDLPQKPVERNQEFAKIATKISKRKCLPRSGFRIFYEAVWSARASSEGKAAT
jgi:hypothetical protein